MPLMTEATLRFVQLRRATDPAETGSCATGPKVVAAVVDFRDDWSPPVREAVTGRNRERAQALLAERAKERDDSLEEAGRLALAVLLRAAVDARLTVGQLRAAIAGWSAERRVTADQLRGSVTGLTHWTVDMITLGRFLRLPKSAVSAVLTRLLRGLALIRLAGSKAEDACL